MDDTLNLLVTLFDGETLARVALRIPHGRNLFPDHKHGLRHYEEQFADMLPDHVRSLGPIADIEEIFEVVVPETVAAP